MPGPAFVSPGAEAGNAIAKFLLQRELQDRQDRLDALAQQKQAAEISNREMLTKLQQQQEARQASDSAATRASLQDERDFRQAATISDKAIPGDLVNDTTFKLLNDQGFGGQVRSVPGVIMQGPVQGDDQSDTAREAEIGKSPDTRQMRGGSQYINARAAEEARAAIAAETEAGRNERAAADLRMEKYIAQLAASGKAENQSIANDLKRLQITGLKDKAEEAKTAKATAAAGVASTRQQVRDLASGLIADPALDSITGPIEGRVGPYISGPAIDAKRRLDQLVSTLALSERGKMKGQGQISDFEGRLLANAVSAIDRTAGPDEVRKHLRDIVQAFQGDTPQAGQGGPPPSDQPPPGTTQKRSFTLLP
jgi:hypothetical protein